MYLSVGDRASDSPIIGYRGDANANQSGDLVPEGEYRVKVYFQPVSGEERWYCGIRSFGTWRVSYAEARVTAQIVGGKYGGWVVHTAVSTLGMESNRKCTAIDLLRAVGYPAVSRAPQTDIVRVLNLILSSEPECVASVGWSATRWDESRKCPVVLRRSMGRFPKDERGNYIPEIVIPGGEVVRAKNTVRAWSLIR
jgi:hypothetical protein